MKLGTLSVAYEALEALFRTNLPVRTAYSVHKLIEPVRRELNSLEGMRLKLLEKHTVDGVVNREAFMEEYNQLLESECTLTLPPIPISEVLDSDVKIAPLALNILISTGVLSED